MRHTSADRYRIPLFATLIWSLFATSALAEPRSAPESPYAEVDRIFEDYRLDSHIPGLVYGIVENGALVHVGTLGVAEVESKRPVTRETLFRIASMTKAFTALTVLKLRDDGKLRLDALAEEYVPELRNWKYPTADSPRIRVRDLLNHTAGFVTDDPWGDRQTPLPENEFTALLRNGVPFTTAPQSKFEYSNLGFALLGRIISNVTHRYYADAITSTLLRPLEMPSSTFVAQSAPIERRALGYRWEDAQWRAEPELGPGAFGAMGGLQTNAPDYAKWVAFLLSAWPARDEPDSGLVKRATVRELAQGSNFPEVRRRSGPGDDQHCDRASNYAMGFYVLADCDLGTILSHSGGYPGFGSNVLLMPERGVGIFAFANRTYAGVSKPVMNSALALLIAGKLPEKRPLPVSPSLRDAYRASGSIYTAGNVAGERNLLAMNFLLDRSEKGRAADIEKLKSEVGSCDVGSPIEPDGQLSGAFVWRCERGRIRGNLQLSPEVVPKIQSLELEIISP